MSSFFGTMQVMVVCLTIIFLACAILLALPKSKLRSCVGEALKYVAALILLVLVVSPVDVLPDVIPLLGWSDDLGYIAAAVAAVYSARKEREQRRLLP